MPGDEAEAVTGQVDRSGIGPRHAAPRKSILTRLQVPAGKVIALAAMPTAMLLGMGLTPRLAQADELPKSPFAPGPCVAAPDKATADGTDDTDATGTKPDAKDPRGKGGSDTADRKDTVSPSPAARPSPSAKRSPSPAAASGSRSASPSPSVTPSGAPASSRPGGLLDPILNPVGDLLGLGGGKDQTAAPTGPTPSPSASPSPSATAKPGLAPRATRGQPPRPSASPDKSSLGKPVRDLIDSVTGEPTASASPSSTARPSASPDPSATKDPDEAQPYPCPVKSEVAGQDEQTPNLLPNQPWTLKSSLLFLHGLQYHGVVNVKTMGGTVKQALKFTADGVDIGDLHQLVQASEGLTYHVAARDGSTSTIRNGTVTLYTEKLSGKLLGLVPITFSPKFPPPITLPELFFTDVEVVQAGQFGGTLTVPGMHVFSTRG